MYNPTVLRLLSMSYIYILRDSIYIHRINVCEIPYVYTGLMYVRFVAQGELLTNFKQGVLSPVEGWIGKKPVSWMGTT